MSLRKDMVEWKKKEKHGAEHQDNCLKQKNLSLTFHEKNHDGRKKDMGADNAEIQNYGSVKKTFFWHKKDTLSRNQNYGFTKKVWRNT